jgi:acylglycerol lipase
VKPSWLLVYAALVCNGSVVCAEGLYPVSVPVPHGSPNPVYKQFDVSARDGLKLVVHEWRPAKKFAGKPVILFVHGIGMHGKPYASIAAGFTSKGIAFVVPDLRGHGLSKGKRGELAEPHELRADLGTVIVEIQKHYRGAPIVLAGESMGGLLAADYAWRGEQRLAGLALLAPAFQVHPSIKADPDEISNALRKGYVSLETKAQLAASTASPGFMKARIEDKLALDHVKLSYLVVLARLQQKWPKAAVKIKLPLFVGVAGRDRVVDPEAVKRFYKDAATPKKKKMWRQWDKAYHTVCWDPLTPDVVEDLAKWALDCSR